MRNQEIAKLLRQIAAVYIVKGENRFKIIAYENAADAIEKSMESVEDLWEKKKLSSIPGVGSALTSHLTELFETGRVKHFEKVIQDMPKGMFPLLNVPGLGPKTSYALARKFKLNNEKTAIDDLLKKAKQGKIAPLENFGEKSEKDIIDSLVRYKKGLKKKKRISLYMSYRVSEQIIDYLKENRNIKEVHTVGSLRRMQETTGDIDIAASTLDNENVIDWFVNYKDTQKVVEKGPTRATIILKNGIQVDLRVTTPMSFGAMLQYFTGNKVHNIKLREYAIKKGLSLSEYGIKQTRKVKSSKFKAQNYNKKLNIYEYPTEEEFYNALNLAWIPPELRTDRGEIEAAAQEYNHKKPGLPKLVQLSDLKGDMHIHTSFDLETYYDLGVSSLAEILKKAEELNYEYIGLSDHNPSQTTHSEKDFVRILKARKEYYEHILLKTKSTRVKIFIMLEVDILPNGKLAIPEVAFDYLDAVVVSVHSSFRMNKKQMTKRVLSGLSHKKAKILGHPTGRLIGTRPGYELDWEQIFSFCHKNDKALEINSYPDRLDLTDKVAYQAIKKNVKLVVNTDSHDKKDMSNTKFGISVARRAWATKSDIINCVPYQKMKKWLLN